MTAREPPCRLVRRFYGEVGKTPMGRAVGEIGAIFGAV